MYGSQASKEGMGNGQKPPPAMFSQCSMVRGAQISGYFFPVSDPRASEKENGLGQEPQHAMFSQCSMVHGVLPETH